MRLRELLGFLVLVLVLAGWLFVYRPWRASQVARKVRARIETCVAEERSYYPPSFWRYQEPSSRRYCEEEA